MKAIRLILTTALLSASVLLYTDNATAQTRNGRGNHRTETSANRNTTTKSNRNTLVGKNEKATINRSATQKNNHRVATTTNTAKPNKTTNKTTNKKINNNSTNKDRNKNTAIKNNNKNSNEPGESNMHRHENPKGHVNKPIKPNNPGHKPGGNKHHDSHGNSAPKPGVKPHNDYKHHDYHPPRPGGGHWGPPPHNDYRWTRPVPPPPPHHHVNPGVPVINTVFGLTFGTFIDYGINALVNFGYNVVGYVNNTIYMTNVMQFGYNWPDVQLYYNDGLLSSTIMQYWSYTPDQTRYNSLHRQLCTLYGSPIASSHNNGFKTVSWWGGNYTGYVTLEYGYGHSDMGHAGYYTNLIIGSNY